MKAPPVKRLLRPIPLIILFSVALGYAMLDLTQLSATTGAGRFGTAAPLTLLSNSFFLIFAVLPVWVWMSTSLLGWGLSAEVRSRYGSARSLLTRTGIRDGWVVAFALILGCAILAALVDTGAWLAGAGAVADSFSSGRAGMSNSAAAALARFIIQAVNLAAFLVAIRAGLTLVGLLSGSAVLARVSGVALCLAMAGLNFLEVRPGAPVAPGQLLNMVGAQEHPIGILVRAGLVLGLLSVTVMLARVPDANVGRPPGQRRSPQCRLPPWRRPAAVALSTAGIAAAFSVSGPPEQGLLALLPGSRATVTQLLAEAMLGIGFALWLVIRSGAAERAQEQHLLRLGSHRVFFLAQLTSDLRAIGSFLALLIVSGGGGFVLGASHPTTWAPERWMLYSTLGIGSLAALSGCALALLRFLRSLTRTPWVTVAGITFLAALTLLPSAIGPEGHLSWSAALETLIPPGALAVLFVLLSAFLANRRDFQLRVRKMPYVHRV